MSKRDENSDMENVKFRVADHQFAYLNANIIALETGDSNLLMLGLMGQEASNSLHPLMIAEITNNRTVNMVPMFPAPVRARNGIIGDYYVHGAGSVIMECQYGGGISGALYEDLWNWYADHSYMMYYEYEALHGFQGNRDAMKCCIKQYDHTDETWRTWRNWDDVWESF